MLESLEQNCVNVWILQRDLDALVADASRDPSLRAFAKKVQRHVREHRLAPVGIQILTPDGDLLAKASVNQDRLMGHRGASRYRKVLEAGQARWAALAAGSPKAVWR